MHYPNQENVDNVNKINNYLTSPNLPSLTDYQTASINNPMTLAQGLRNANQAEFADYDLDMQIKNLQALMPDNPALQQQYSAALTNALASQLNAQAGITDPSPQGQNNNFSSTLFGYPILRDDKRGLFNLAIEKFVQLSNNSQIDNGFINQVIGAAKDLGENYINMINANYKSTPEMQKQGTTIDNYYHCIGNYNAAKQGHWGALAAQIIGLGREILDYPINIFVKNRSIQEANNDFLNDMKINYSGQNMARENKYNSVFDACDKYRPNGYNPLERLQYYRK